MGEGARYFAARGCFVTALDTEPRLVAAGRLISNIERQETVFSVHDFDYDELECTWDTIALLSVLHHFLTLKTRSGESSLAADGAS